ncbi:hypothetical protein [Noviherbaspirillum denitrificans]|uniref:hypothetical protein n=1 Tax=Noviherbaspirillum denitrificans TaxID=1968433 RepID=UPI00197D4F30|nr:hypothetical protein [Noviherbaspirillum denitrificans]
MPLAQIPLDRDPHVIADWFEFHVLCSEYSVGQLRSLQRAWDRRRNSESSDPEGRALEDGAPDEQFLEEILAEFQKRMECLGDHYPFQFNDTEEELLLKNDISDGAMLYLFCLFLSSVKSSEIFELDRFDFELNNRIRDLFQACATWAAAGALEGCAIAFGFPRPDGSPYLDKLRSTYALFGEGTVREAPLPGVSTNPKDEGIDVIAWKPRNDNAAGTFYMLGQAASGGNWPSKSVLEYFRPFHENWFSEIPASEPTAALFIPFCIPLTGGATLKQQLHVLTKRYGAIYYRYMIPVLAYRGLGLTADQRLTVERTTDFPEIAAWVTERITELKQAATA